MQRPDLLYFLRVMTRFFAALALSLAAVPLAANAHVELLSEEENAWIHSLGRPLIVGVEEDYRPYNFFDEQGEISGFVGDYLRLLEERLGIQIEVRSFAKFSDVLEAAQGREVDILPLLLSTPERSRYLDFTQPVYVTRDRIFTRRETQGTVTLDDLVGRRLAIVEGYSQQTRIAASHPGIEIVPVASELDGLMALSLGRVDAFITEIGVASYYIENQGVTNLRIAGEYGTTGNVSFATRNDWPLLASIIGKGLASIRPEEQVEIERRWVLSDAIDRTDIVRIWNQVRTIVGVMLVALAAILVWTFSLRRLVALRTRALEIELAERRIVEAARLRLAIAVEQSAEFVLIIGKTGKIEYANRSFRKALGMGELEGTPIGELASAKSGDTLSEALKVVQDSGRWRGKLLFGRGEEEALKVMMAIAPILDEDDEIDGYVATARDLTREEELEERVQRAQRLSALGTFAGGIAHDFNNLLVPILGYADLVRAESSGEVDSYVEGITKAAERARDLIQRIMIFGRDSDGEMRPLDLRFEIEDSLDFLRSLLPATIELQHDLGEVGTIAADKTQIQQLLLNLCSNAGEAMAETGGSLRIGLEARSVGQDGDATLPELLPGEYAVITVADTGVGMNEETREKIFDPYFSARQDDGGTGLGLAIVHGIVSQHDGLIHVDSTPGVGTSVQVFLPIVDVESVPPDSERGVNIHCGKGETIMLVDDDELVLNTLKKMLEGIGYRISAWSDPVAALNAFASDPQAFAAVLADLTMPGLTGIELNSQMTDIRPAVPFAILTGNIGALQNYDGNVISKPIALPELAAVLQEILRSSKPVTS